MLAGVFNCGFLKYPPFGQAPIGPKRVDRRLPLANRGVTKANHETSDYLQFGD